MNYITVREIELDFLGFRLVITGAENKFMFNDCRKKQPLYHLNSISLGK